MRTGLALAVIAVALVAGRVAHAADPAPGEATVMLDMQMQRVAVYSLEGLPESRPDDLVPVGERFVVPRGTEPFLRFRTDGGKLWQFGADKKERLVGALAVARKDDGTFDQEPEEGVTYHGEKPVEDALCSLTDEEIASLRCVCVMGWSDEIAAKLAKADLTKTCVVVARGRGRPIPPLPADTRFVAMRGRRSSSSGPRDLAPLAKLTSLRFLSLGPCYNETTDLAPLATLTDLAHLDLGFRDIEHADALAKLTSLRVLAADGCDGLGDIAFTAPMRGLRRISIGSTKVADLSPLTDHAELRVLHADLTPVRVLPKGDLRALREFRLLSAPVAADEVAAFARERPDCKVVHGWGSLLANAIARVDRVRVRSGGLCHRRIKEEKTLLEITAAGDIAEFIGLIRIDESGPGSMCMCCGNPTFEFYEGRKLVASLGYHHGKTLRWPGGDWPGDALLDAAAADRLCEWLASHGVAGPKEDRDDTARRAAEAKARDAEQDELLGAERIDAIAGADSVADAAKVFAACFPDRAVRLERLFRLGTRETRSGNVERRDRVVAQAKWVLLGEEDAAAVVAFLGGKIAEGGAVGAAAAQIVGSMRGERFDPVALEALRLSAARLLLASNAARRAISILANSKSPAADAILLSLLPAADERGEPVGAVTVLHADAAIELARRCDESLLPRLRAIVLKAPKSRDGSADVKLFDEIVSERKPPAGGK